MDMQIQNLPILNTDMIVYKGGNVRIKEDMLKQRDVVIKGMTNYRILIIYISTAA